MGAKDKGTWKLIPNKGEKFKPKDFHPSFAMNPPNVNIKDRKGKYYHLTEAKNIESILSEGLKASDGGLIWLFESMDRSTLLSVALIKNMDFKNFGIIEIDAAGMTGFLTVENYTGSTYKHIFLKQNVIDPQHLELEGIYSINVVKITNK